MPGARSKLVSWIAISVIATVTFFVFLPAIDNGFVNWDDQRDLVNNPNFHGFGREQVRWMWTNHLSYHYVPLTWMSFAVDYLIFRDKAAGYHFTNILLHAANAAIFFLIALTLLRSASRLNPADHSAHWGAAFAALFFSLHPLRVESVAWVTERRDVLSGLFYLLAILVYIRAFRLPTASMPRTSYAICLVLFVLSVLSKEITVTLPIVLVLLDIYPLRRVGSGGRVTSREVLKACLEKLPFFVIALCAGVHAIWIGMPSVMQPVSSLGFVPRVAITIYDLAFYLFKTIVPINLSPLYPLTRLKTSLAGLPFQLSAAVVVLITLLSLLLRPRFPGVLLAWVAFAITLFPVSGILHNGLQIAADRYTYLACLPWALLAGAGFAAIRRALRDSPTHKIYASAAALLIFITLSLLTRKQISVWRDSDTLWTQAISVEPFFASHLNLASSLFNEGDTAGAISHYRQAIALWPDNAALHTMLGGALLETHQLQQATIEFQLATQLGPNKDAYKGLTAALVMQGKFDEAIEALQEAIRANPGDAAYQELLERTKEFKMTSEHHTKPAGNQTEKP